MQKAHTEPDFFTNLKVSERKTPQVAQRLDYEPFQIHTYIFFLSFLQLLQATTTVLESMCKQQ
jgi:hypothetical protein